MVDLVDKIMNEEDPEKEVAEEVEVKGEPEKTGDEVKEDEPPSFEDRLATIEKANKGLESALTAEREKRHNAEGRYQELHKTVVDTISKRKEPEPAVEEDPKRYHLSYDEDGNPFIDPATVKEMTSAETKSLRAELADMKNQLTQSKTQETNLAAFRREVSSVISEKPVYEDAYKDFSKAHGWLIQKVDRFFKDTKIDLGEKPVASQIVEVVEGTTVETEFNQAFPGYDFERVMRGHVTKRDLRKALDSVMSVKKPSADNTDSLKEIAGKPTGLSSTTNQKTNESGPTLADLAALARNVENMSDAEYEKFNEDLERLS